MSRLKLKPAITFLAALVLITSHTQLTVRQLGLRLAGVREGNVQQVLSLESYVETQPRFDRSRLHVPVKALTNQLAVLKDNFGTFIQGELVGKKVFINGSSFDVLDNTATHILVACEDISEVDSVLNTTNRYKTGYAQESVLVRLALSIPSINLTISDFLLALLAIMLAAQSLKERDPLKSHSPFLAAAPFIIIGIFSLIPAFRLFDSSSMEPELRKGLLELIQHIEVLVVGYWCFARLFGCEENRKRFPALLMAMGAVVVLIGIIEYIAVFSGWTLRGLLDVESIDSTFGISYNSPRAWSAGSESNRNILALYLAMLFPFALLGIRSATKRWMQIAAVCLAVGALILIMHMWLLIITVIVGGILVYSWQSLKGIVIYSLILLVVFSTLTAVNKHHGKVLIDSIASHRTKDTYGLQPLPLKGTDFTGQNVWQQKYLEKQAAWNAVSFSPVLGLGVGNYQAVINTFYENSKVDGHALVKQPINLMERNSHSLFMVTMVETGVLGLICLGIYLLLPVLKLSKMAIRQPAPVPPLAAALIAAATIIFISSFQFSFMVRGIQLIAVAVLGCSYAMTNKKVESEI